MARDPKQNPRGGHADLHAHAIDADAVQGRARAYAASKGIPFTQMRQRVLALLAASGKPMAAYEIAEKLSDARRVQAVQVYRALEFLQEAGCVHRLASQSSYFACDHQHGSGETVVFMVCSQCGAVQEAASNLVARGLLGVAKTSGFKPLHPIVELEGECASCNSQPAR
ncbi:Fur family transcriptional regulator [Bradyrhizobium diversitatis]|uniref:Transcriptional repressor n=1 Tax=Bradyrhizobium diversitatis TaxID=2755406 RepID=A0ABS0NUT0_9BRAD|nr:transcriptional repressor [Bradyrhizobium diversitatis]MBH5384756.1 transcriptional repressor [Bradyrhizobium diversitatis]